MRMALLRSSFLLLLIGMCSPILFGTTIVIRATADYVVVGADSLWTYDTSTKDKRGKKGSIRSSGYHCKIHQFNDAFFTHAGYAGSDILQLAAQASKQGTTIEEKAHIFNELLEPRLKTDMERMRLEFPDPYREMLGTEGTVFEAAFFGMNYDRPIVALVEYKIVSPSAQSVALECGFPGCVRVVNDLPWSNWYFGESKEIYEIGAEANFWRSNGPNEAIRKLITIEMASHPGTVGGNIDILSMSIGGIRWVQHGPECPEITPIKKTTHK